MVDLCTEHKVDSWAESLLQQRADNSVGVNLAPEAALAKDAVVTNSGSNLPGGKVPEEVSCETDLLVHAVGVLEREDPGGSNLQIGWYRRELDSVHWWDSWMCV